ncbi:MAG TPA: hypothetical protein VJ770_01650 [Stellaceae bacterium]|nr:hypothetical protein [Stellaceae bacterium]
MSTPLPIIPLLVLYSLAAGLAFVVTKPSSGLRSVVVTLLIGAAMLAGLSFAVNALVAEIAFEASWYYADQ